MGDFDQQRPTWKSLSEPAKDLVRRFLVLDQSSRLTCQQALRHEWVTAAEAPTHLSCMPGLAGQDGLATCLPQLVTLLLRVPQLSMGQRCSLAACAAAARESDLTPAIPWRELFLDLDRDHDGRLSVNEMVHGLRRCLAGSATQLPDKQLQACAEALDLDQSGHIEWLEWVAIGLLGSRLGTSEAAEPVATAFRLLSNPVHSTCLEKDLETERTMVQVIHDWVKQVYDDPGEMFTLSDLRFVISTTET